MSKKDKKKDQKSASPTAKTAETTSGSPKLYCRVVPLLKPSKCIVPSVNSIVPINYDSDPIIINNEHFTGYAVFRVVNFDGHNPIDPKTGKPMPVITSNDYFKGHRRTFSLQISGRFRKEWSADEVMFGTFFDKPVKMPPGYKIALALAKKIDASMDGDLSLDKPYMCSPLICAMNIARAEPIILSSLKDGKLEEDQTVSFSHDAERTGLNQPLYLPKWKGAGGKHIEENFMETVASWPESKLHHQHIEEDDSDPLKEEPEVVAPKRTGSFMNFFSRTSSTNEMIKKEPAAVTPTQRRSWFLNPDHRKSYLFRPDTLYTFDFNNQYVDLNKMQLKLGITFDVSYYLNGQPVRYQMRSRDGSIIFFTIELGLA
jgi:hypothetical protein